MKKTFFKFLGSIALLLLMVVTISCREAVASGAPSGATLKLEFGWISPDSYRNAAQDPSGRSFGWLGLPYWNNGAAALKDSNGNVVDSYTNQARHEFKIFEPGTYTIDLSPVMNSGKYYIVKSIVNGGPISHLIESNQSSNLQVNITSNDVQDGNTILRWVVIEYKAFGLKTTTPIGEFANGTKAREYYYGGNWDFVNTDPSTKTNNPTLNTHNGIYYGDSANLYSGMNSLEVPKLNAEEAALGYQFMGWKLGGDTSGKIYTESEALAYKITGNTIFEAVWELPKHTITFITDLEKGQLIDGVNNGEHLTFIIEGNKSMKDAGFEVPTLKEMPGWRFKGWYIDTNTTNVIADEEIVNSRVTDDITYYAKYDRLYTITYSDGAGGVVFADKVIPNLKEGAPTPAFNEVPERMGWRFLGWTPAVAEKVTGNAVYFATWEPLADDVVYTVIYTDDVGRTAFEDQVYSNLKEGEATPAYSGTPMRVGFKFIDWNPKVADKVTGDAVYFAAWEPVTDVPDIDIPMTHTVLFLPAEQGKLNGRDKHTVPNGEYVPMIPEVEANEGYTFLEKWEVTDINGDTDFVQVGDVLNEINISHLRITYDVTFKALYKAASTPTPTVAPTDTPTPTPASTATVKPTSTPIPQPIVTPKPYDPGYTYKFSFTKEWQGGIEDSIDWTLYDANGNVVHKKFNKKVVNEKEWSYEAWFATSVDYYLIENIPAGYKVRYENVGAHAGETDRLYNGGTIINYKVPQTGDQFNPWLWLGGILLGLGAVCGTIRIDRRKKTRQ